MRSDPSPRRPRPIHRFALLLALAILPATDAFAGWNPTGVAASTGTGAQGSPAIDSDGAGGSLLVFQDRRSGAYDIAVQRIDAAGALPWGATGTIACAATGNQLNPGIVADGSGGAIVFWDDARAGFATDIYAQRVDASGVTQWTADGVAVSTAAQQQANPVGVSDDAGGVILAWADRRNGSTANYDVYAQRLDGDGMPLWTANGVAACQVNGLQTGVRIVRDGSGGAWVAWIDSRAGGGATHVYAQRVDATGTALYVAGGIPICTAGGSRSALAISPAPSGGVTLAWRDTRNGLGELFVQQVDGTGAVQWTANGISIATTVNSTVALAADGAAQYLAWDDTRDVGETQIYAQRIDATGAPVWAGGLAVCSAPGSQLEPRAATDAFGRLIAAWRDGRGPGTDVYAQRITAGGAVDWAADGVPLCAFPDFRQSMVITLGPSDEILAAWDDRRDDVSGDLYAQRLDPASPPGTFTVDQIGDAGAGSLRQALLDANATPGLDRIVFAIPGSGPHVIQPFSPLPAISAPVVLDGFTQAGSAFNTAHAAQPGNGAIAVDLDGSVAGGIGLDVSAAGTTIRGLAVRGFSGSGIRLAGADGSAVEGCHVGTDAAGTTALGNGGDGIEASSAAGIHVGSQSLAGRNVIAGNAGDGVRMTDVAGVHVSGNHVGLDAAAGPLGNGGAGVHVAGISIDVQIGLTTDSPSSNLEIPIGGNAIRHNGDDGIRIEPDVSAPILVSANGIDANGGLGLDTAEDGVNGASVAASFTPAPVITRAFLNSGDQLELEGSLAGPPNATVTVHIFSSDACDASGGGEGARYFSSFTQLLDGSGAANFSRTISIPEPVAGPAVPGDAVTAVVLVPGGATSEFSTCRTMINTDVGTGSMVTLGDPGTGTAADLTFDEVTSAGVTTYTVTGSAPTVPAGFEIGDPPLFYDVSTTATFTGAVEVCVHYDEGAIGIPETDLRLLHYDSGSGMWEDATTTVDVGANVICGSVTSFSPFAIVRTSTTAVGDPAAAGRTWFGPAAPNPLRARTSFALELPARGPVDVRVYDAGGRVVRTLAAGTFPPGRHVIEWDGADADGTRLAPGIYFARATVAGRQFVRRVVRLR